MPQPQERNAQLVHILRTDFLHLTDPARTIEVDTTTAATTNPPTDAELDTLLGSPANLPTNCMIVVHITDVPIKFLVLSDTANAWWYVALTLAV
jgi:hypothetical protein